MRSRRTQVALGTQKNSGSKNPPLRNVGSGRRPTVGLLITRARQSGDGFVSRK